MQKLTQLISRSLVIFAFMAFIISLTTPVYAAFPGKNSQQKKENITSTTSQSKVSFVGSEFTAKNMSENSISNLVKGDSPDKLLLIIIALFIPPLAVYLHFGKWNGTCWLNLILTFLFFIPGFIHALIVILGNK